MDGNNTSFTWVKNLNNVPSVFDHLLKSNVLVDCTLTAEGQYLRAHKLVLSAFSSYFKGLFTQESEKNTIVFFRETKFEDVKGMIELIYSGKVKVQKQKLKSFTSFVKSLQIKGFDVDFENKFPIDNNKTSERIGEPVLPVPQKRKKDDPKLTENITQKSPELVVIEEESINNITTAQPAIEMDTSSILTLNPSVFDAQLPTDTFSLPMQSDAESDSEELKPVLQINVPPSEYFDISKKDLSENIVSTPHNGTQLHSSVLKKSVNPKPSNQDGPKSSLQEPLSQPIQRLPQQKTVLLQSHGKRSPLSLVTVLTPPQSSSSSSKIPSSLPQRNQPLTQSSEQVRAQSQQELFQATKLGTTKLAVATVPQQLSPQKTPVSSQPTGKKTQSSHVIVPSSRPLEKVNVSSTKPLKKVQSRKRPLITQSVTLSDTSIKPIQTVIEDPTQSGNNNTVVAEETTPCQRLKPPYKVIKRLIIPIPSPDLHLMKSPYIASGSKSVEENKQLKQIPSLMPDSEKHSSNVNTNVPLVPTTTRTISADATEGHSTINTSLRTKVTPVTDKRKTLIDLT